MLRVGIIGYGDHAQKVHAKILMNLRSVKLVGIAEPDFNRQVKARRRVPSANIFSDYVELLKSQALDAVFICLPPALHAPAAIAAMENHQAIYIEKPLALDMRDAKAMTQTWRDTGVVAMIGFNYRFHPLYQSARKFAQAGGVGKILYAHSVFSMPLRNPTRWKQIQAGGGSALLELGSHHIDLIRFLFEQEITRVFAQTESLESEADQTTVEMELGNGVRVQSIFSLRSIAEERFEIYGTAGKLTVDRFLDDDLEFTNSARDRARYDRTVHAVRAFSRSLYTNAFSRGSRLDPSYHAAITQFAAAVRGDQVDYPDLDDGSESLRVTRAARWSAETHHLVTLAEFRDEDLAD